LEELDFGVSDNSFARSITSCRVPPFIFSISMKAYSFVYNIYSALIHINTKFKTTQTKVKDLAGYLIIEICEKWWFPGKKLTYLN
jgi:hypothetical protein